MTKTLRTCPKGHEYYKSSDCTTCPVCAKKNKPKEGLLSNFSSPVRNALTHAGIQTIEQLAEYTEQEILSLHGIGKTALPLFHELLAEHGLQFKS